eukprot:COSAG01_NODE_10009_length_2276_cov_2.151585_2_plen_432_part_00
MRPGRIACQVGVVVAWQHFTLDNRAESVRSEYSSVEAGTGKVVSVMEEEVKVKRLTPTRGRRIFSVPREHLVRRQRDEPLQEPPAPVPEVAAAAAAAKAPRSTKRKPVGSSSEAPHRKSTRVEAQGESTQKMLRRIEQELTSLQAQLVGETQRRAQAEKDVAQAWAQVKLLEEKIRKAASYQAKKAAVAKPSDVNSQAERPPPDPEAPRQDLSGQTFHGVLGGKSIVLKEHGERGRVSDTVRDLVTNMNVKLGYPAHTIFPCLEMVLKALGCDPQGVPSDSKRLVTQCVVERAVMLFDDQVRRMAEKSAKNRSESAGEMKIRTEPWSAEEAEQWDCVADSAKEDWQQGVGSEIDAWLHKVGYRVDKDLPDPESIDVGDHATVLEEFTSALCATLFCGVDGTSHARCALSCFCCAVHICHACVEKLWLTVCR